MRASSRKEKNDTIAFPDWGRNTARSNLPKPANDRKRTTLGESRKTISRSILASKRNWTEAGSSFEEFKIIFHTCENKEKRDLNRELGHNGPSILSTVLQESIIESEDARIFENLETRVKVGNVHLSDSLYSLGRYSEKINELRYFMHELSRNYAEILSLKNSKKLNRKKSIASKRKSIQTGVGVLKSISEQNLGRQREMQDMFKRLFISKKQVS
jgi:hypothetical protein